MRAVIVFVVIMLFIFLSVTVYALSESDFITKERDSPSDWIKQDQIQVFNDKVILNIENSNWLYFADTNSMDPFLDVGSNAIQITPESPESIAVGDIITYYSGDDLIIHRVVEKNEDDVGFYFTAQGDNNSFTDPVKVRFEDVNGVVVAVIY